MHRLSERFPGRLCDGRRLHARARSGARPEGAEIEATSSIQGGLRAAWAIVGLLTAARVLGLLVSPVELHGDEAQYWAWSRTFDFGYFSKPPLVAWAAAATTAIFGDHEWAVRLATPLSHAVAALFLMAAARRRWGDQAAAWTGLLYITMPAVWLSSAVLSTDAFLMALWAGALWAFDRYVDRPSLARALALGAFVGAGFLAKYAMVYFVIGAGLLAVLHEPSRTALLAPATLAAGAVVAAFLAPNLIWNATHEFATISHTAANANWGAGLFNPGELLTFFGDQFGVFGPIQFTLLLAALVGIARMPAAARDTWLPLAAFVAPALAIVGVQAFLNRANANWAVASYAAGTILVVAWALRETTQVRLPLGRRGIAITGRRLLAVALALHFAVGAAFAAAALFPPVADRVGLANAFKRTRGWEETAAIVRAAYEAGDRGAPYAAVLVDNRLLFHDLEYYTREAPLPLRMWLRYGAPASHAEASAPMAPVDGPVLVVVEREADLARMRADFAHDGPGEERVIALGGGKERRLILFPARGFAPLPRGPEYEAEWGG